MLNRAVNEAKKAIAEEKNNSFEGTVEGSHSEKYPKEKHPDLDFDSFKPLAFSDSEEEEAKDVIEKEVENDPDEQMEHQVKQTREE
ncbi:unnamed protein product, partial [Ilex paraguariensis]